jgi:hypothetical protein
MQSYPTLARQKSPYATRLFRRQLTSAMIVYVINQFKVNEGLPWQE